MSVEAVLDIAAVTLAICALAAALAARQGARRWRRHCDALEARIAGVRRELELVASTSARTVRRVQRVEREFSGVTERVDQVESRPAPGAESLGHAIDCARRGADSTRLAQQFGLSRGEAELVARLHCRARVN